MFAILKKSGKGSRSDSCENAEFLAADSPEFDEYRGKIDHAIALIGATTPGFAIEMQSVVDCISIVDDQASFRGASGLTLRGMVMLSPDPTWTTGVFAEELVHETTHSLLDLISIRQPFFGGEDALTEKWSAPFRPDKRPLIGNFHALVVICRLVHLFGNLRRSNAGLELDWLGRASDYVARSNEVLAAIENYPSLNPMARRLLEHLVKPTIALFPERFELMYP
jgi:HEXXH motif-containing protein